MPRKSSRKPKAIPSQSKINDSWFKKSNNKNKKDKKPPPPKKVAKKHFNQQLYSESSDDNNTLFSDKCLNLLDTNNKNDIIDLNTDEDDELLNRLNEKPKTNYKNMLKSYNNPTNRYIGRRSKRIASSFELDTDDLKKELDLSDSDSESTLLANSILGKRSKKPNVRHSFNSLVKDLSDRVVSEQTREIFDKEIERNIFVSNDNISPEFSLIPGSEDIIKNREIYVDSDIKWIKRYSFCNWNGKDLTEYCNPEQLLKYIKQCPPILAKYMSSYIKNNAVSELAINFIVEGILSSKLWKLPDSILLWMFHTVCYANELESLLKPCFNNLISLISQQKYSQTSCLFSSSYYNRELETQYQKRNWIVPYDSIILVFTNYGLNPFSKENISDNNQLYSTTQPNNISLFPIINFTYVIRLIECSIKYKSHLYTIKQIYSIFQYICCFLIDPMLTPALLQLQSLIDTILSILPKESWISNELETLFNLIYNPIISNEIQHHCLIANRLPFSKLAIQFRTYYTFNVLRKSFNDTTPYKVSSKVYISLRFIIPIVMNLISEIQNIKEKQNKLNYTDIYIKIFLIDLAIDKTKICSTTKIEQCNKLKECLTELNLSLPDEKGINIARTRVKEYISRLEGSILMIIAMGKHKKTSKYDRSNIVITEFFKKQS